ncbi:TolC family protein [Granulicella arctica]|uniref:Cobalt-zinc-cadmium efflux system outer membrane protein n=1 Tax=Granulicella arctica TaxID=940613 RepID=A0A7Y9TUV1_9BACT|nr:TolC family protein [Granulicella arctica]NYF81163.1 cobalt-zinc-cadmium efflux system outer membrane protein [Granulicella arctica]
MILSNVIQKQYTGLLRLGILLLPFFAGVAYAQSSYTWDQIKTRFETANPALKADASNVDELKAEEITAYLRPNPQFTLSEDGVQIARYQGVWQPLSGVQLQPNFSYLHERDHKRELRLESAKEATGIGRSLHEDLERNLLFNLRSAFVQTLEAKAVLELAKSDLEYYDKIIEISHARYKAGDLAQIDLDRIELLRVQYESEIQTAIVNLRSQKIALLQLLNDRTAVDQFDVNGPFGFTGDLKPLNDFEQVALDARPDLRAALQSIEQAKTNHKLAVSNGSTDPTFGAWYTYNPSFNNQYDHQSLGLSVNIPLRIFDRNQGEKKRTLIDIDRNQQLTDVTRAQVFSDVDSAYEQARSNVALLVSYRDKYKDQATRVRDTVTYAYQHGGASLMDFLNAQSDYRTVQLAYLQLIGAYLTAASQLNLAVGREVIQ